jgi:hypothetical protein
MVNEPLYTRVLPGGGYVVIESTLENAEYRVSLWVERRVDPLRRDGHRPPVVAQITGADAVQAAVELLKIAADNVEVAQAIRRWQSAQADRAD